MPAPVGRHRRWTGWAAIACSVALLVGCSSSDTSDSKVAATVDGTDISASTVQADLQAEVDAANKTKSAIPQGLYASGADRSPLETTDAKHVFSSTSAADKLSNLVLDQLLVAELARLKVTVTAADRTAAEASLCQGSTGCLDAYPVTFKKRLIEQQARLEAYKRAAPGAKPPAPTDAALLAEAQKQYDDAVAQAPSNMDQICFLASQFSDQATADSIKAQVEAGGDLAALTKAVPGANQGSGGAEQCPLLKVLASQSAPEDLQSAQPGQVLVLPDTASSSFIVVKVTQRRQATFDQIKDDLVAAIKDKQASDDESKVKAALKAALKKVAGKAKIKINSDYGHWSATKLAVVPPAAATAADSTDTGAQPTLLTAPPGSTPETTAPAATTTSPP